MHHGIDHMVGYRTSPPPQGQVGYPPDIRSGDLLCHPGHQTWEPLLVTSGGNYWSHVQTCSFGNSLPQEQHLVVVTETETHTVSKWALRILVRKKA